MTAELPPNPARAAAPDAAPNASAIAAAAAAAAAAPAAIDASDATDAADAIAAADALVALAAARQRHWAGTRRLTAALLLLWLATTFGAVFYARTLAGLTVFGWQLSFYLAAQGASLVYLAILGLYAWRMRRLDLAFRAGLGLPLRVGGRW